MSISQSNVFDKFSFFGILIPGLFATTFLLPIVPVGLLSGNAAGLVLFVVVFSFLIGIVFSILSEPLTRRTRMLSNSVEMTQRLLNKDDIPVGHRDLSPVDENVVDRCLEHLGDLGIVDPYKPAYSKMEATAVHQYILNQVWADGGSPSRIHHSIRMMCRSLTAICLVFGPLVLGVVGLRTREAIVYSPAYGTVMPDLVFAAVAVVAVSLFAFGFVRSHNRYTYYLGVYMLADFARQTADPSP